MGHSKNKILNLMKKYDIRASKKFGQNFLWDEAVVQKIINAADVEGKDVVEVGPGLGALTFPLLAQAECVLAYEIDNQMINVLENEIKNDKFRLMKISFLAAKFNWETPRTLVANIPYNATTKIIFKLIENTSRFSEIVLMVQKEFGERIVALPNTKRYGKLSVALQSIANVEKIADVKSTSFIPAPKVDSMVVKIKFKNEYNKEYFNFLVKCFAKQRKTLVNNLKLFFNKAVIKQALVEIGAKDNIRPQQLAPPELKKLWMHLNA